MELENGCLTCFQRPEINFYKLHSGKNKNMQKVLKQHFWFTEVDFLQAMICPTCWEQMDNFHQFYVSVKELHRNRLDMMIVKSEPGVEQDNNMQVDLSPDSLFVKEENTLEPNEEVVKQESFLLITPIAEELISNGVQCNEAHEPSYEAHSEQALDVLVKHETNPDQAEDHLEEHHSQEVENQDDDDEYIRQHVKFICKLCEKELSSFYKLMAHITSKHGHKTPYIKCCGIKHFAKRYLKKHVQYVNYSEVLQRESGQKNNLSKSILQHQNTENHETEKDRCYKCDLCTMTFTLKHDFNDHMHVHKRYPCEYCNKIYIFGQNLINHIKKKHTDLKKAKFSCSLCPLVFSNCTQYLQHKITHPAACDICGYMSTHPRSLKMHMRWNHTP